MFGRRTGVDAVELVGPDTRRFANGMFTNNVRDLRVGAHQHSAITDDRGRLLALMDLVMLAEDRLFVVLEGMTADDFETRYGKFIVFDDVELVKRPGVVYTFHGEEPPAIDGAICWPSRRSSTGGTDCFVAEGTSVVLDGEPVDERTLEVARIRVGWPRFPVDASDKQLPHELNLRDTHLHFEKGCYRGQEIIHRVEVMGQVRKGLVGVRLAAVAEPGTVLETDGKKVGRLGSVVNDPELGWIGLAVVRTSHQAVGTELHAGEVAAVVRDLT